MSTHRTPLRRVSRGSLAAISRSGNFPDAPANLGFMGPALENLADETEALHANIEGLNALAASLETFNESFASYLYVQKINVFCVEWYQVSPSVCNLVLNIRLCQAPVGASFELAEQRASQ
jgi:DASH complex subunit DAM1